jgi:hypothetical protein
VTVEDFDMAALRRELADRDPRAGRRRDGYARPPWQELAAFEREERADEPPPGPERDAEADWQDAVADRVDDYEDRTLTGELPVGYDPRCFGGVDG